MNKVSYNDVLYHPEEFVPHLCDEQIRGVLIESLSDYREEKIDLKTTVQVAKLLKENTVDYLSPSIKNIINEIHSLHTVEDIFDDMLDELVEN